MQLLPIILSGGSGTRLWPVSREATPKPFMKIAGGKSLLQLTWERACALPGVSHAAVVTNMAYSYKTAEELMDETGAKQISLLLEPVGRNTAPAVALAALWAQAKFGSDVVLVVLAADHLIDKPAEFSAAVADAAALAKREGRLVLFGIEPSAPDTGYGYIEWGMPVARSRAHEVVRFVEKPTIEKATEYLRAGNFVWNSGMFCFTAAAILAALEQHAPKVLQAAQWVAQRSAMNAAGQVLFDAASFNEMPDISIDYAVMEKAANVAVIPCAFGWSDIGSWKAVAETRQTDEAGNSTEGDTILVNSRRTYLRSEDRLVAAVGVEDLVIIDTPDAVLVAHKDSSQQVKDIVAKLKRDGHVTTKEHLTVHRPWGKYTVLHEAPQFKVKRIEVNPGKKLSLQMHHKRSEHWVVVRGSARVTVDERSVDLGPNESIYVPINIKHRIENATDQPLTIVEVACGAYLGEDDIVRFSDDFGRA
ncbi:MAG TPA: mannose-1-phosphate guanylyltransferase/mannose-6-phosphate isomerase [Burkholderiaceae bacterium]|nr:mannose-1-phosphate guanylyltransferase/mannose-6-phosphate isomerase [Burkholderiaceae bacterium]